MMPPETATETSTGATPGTGATPAQEAQTPASAGATPAAGTTGTPPATTPPATGDDGLGDNGKRILAEARRQAKDAEDRARAAETERDALKAATQSESEKATAAAVKEATKATADQYEARIRRSEVRRALTAAGIAESELDLASAAPEFARLKVTDSGDLEGIADVLKSFKTAHPGLFARPSTDAGGPWDGSAGGGSTRQPQTLDEALTAHYRKQ
jgi:hypothetical protein